MTTTNFDVQTDGWLALYSGGAGPNMGNGTGPRLQSGYGASGGETYKQRFYLNFVKPADATIPDDAVITSCTLFLKVRPNNSCWSRGGSPKVLFRRPTDASFSPGENPQGTECIVSGTGAARYPWAGGSAPVTTHQVFWEGTPANGDVIDIDITDMFKDWWAARTGTQNNFVVYGIPSNAAGTDEQDDTAARNIAFHSADADGDPMFSGGLGPYLAVVWTTSAVAPSAPTLNSPANAARITQVGTTRDLNFTYHHSTGDPGTAYDCVVATSSHVSGAGRLDTGVVSDTIDSPLAMVDGSSYTAHINYVSMFAPDEARGTTYYWQIRCTANSLPGPYSAVRSYVVNRVPVNTKVRPT